MPLSILLIIAIGRDMFHSVVQLKFRPFLLYIWYAFWVHLLLFVVMFVFLSLFIAMFRYIIDHSTVNKHHVFFFYLTVEHLSLGMIQLLFNLLSRGVHLNRKILLCLIFRWKKKLKRTLTMKAVERKGGVKRGSTRNMRGVRNVRSMKNDIPQTIENTGKTRRRGDMLRTWKYVASKDFGVHQNLELDLIICRWSHCFNLCSASVLYMSILLVHLITFLYLLVSILCHLQGILNCTIQALPQFSLRSSSH